MSFSDYLPPGCSDADIDVYYGYACDKCGVTLDIDYVESFPEEESIFCVDCLGYTPYSG